MAWKRSRITNHGNLLITTDYDDDYDYDDDNNNIEEDYDGNYWDDHNGNVETLQTLF